MQKFALNILLIEDNDALREATLAFLQSQGHFVRGVSSAEEVTEAEGGFLPDIYIIDLILPAEDGVSLTRRLRAAHPGVGIIITTALARIGDKVIGYRSGADLYLTKPLAPEELIAGLESLAQRLRSFSAPPGTIELKVSALRLSGPAGSVSVSFGEATVLSAFARAPGRSLERWQLAEVISGEGQETPSAGVMEMRIVRLRKKLDAIGAEPPGIKAIHKVGYALCTQLLLT
jgi:DNA-binding response OmpR family regulator